MTSKEFTYYMENNQLILPEEYEQITECVKDKKNLKYHILGFVLGGAAMKFGLDRNKWQIAKLPYAAVIYGGAMTGYIISKVLCIQACINAIKNQNRLISGDTLSSNMGIYERKKNRQDDTEFDLIDVPSTMKRKSVFDMESTQQILDDSPLINENANVEVPEKKIPVESQRNTTYEELRQRNREIYDSKNMPQKQRWIQNQVKEQASPVRRPEKESQESDMFADLDTGKHRTKYGDIWD